MIGWELYKHTLRLYLKDYKALLVTVAFPIVLTLIFVTVFSNLESSTKVATKIVIEGSQGGIITSAYTEYLQGLGGNGKDFFIAVVPKLQSQDSGVVVAVDEGDQTIKIVKSQATSQVEQIVLQLTKSFTNQMMLVANQKQPVLLKVREMVPEQEASSRIALGIASTMLVFVAMLGGQHAMGQVYRGLSARGRRIAVSPVSKNIRAISEYMASVTMILLEVTGLVVVFELLFDIGFGTRWQMMLLLAVGLSLVCAALGVFLGVWIQDGAAADGLLSMLITVLCIASGGLMPNMAAMPVAKFSPVTYIIEAIRETVVRGQYMAMWYVVGSMVLGAVVLLTISILKLRRRAQS